jgi:predicted Zn-dependent protease
MNTSSRQKYASFLGKAAVGKILLVCMFIGIMSGCAGVSVEDMLNLAGAVAKSFEDFTPEQEYYIGRTVGAMIVNKYPPYDQAAANTYLNILGQTLAQASDRPETFKGYHFLILDTDEINAFAAPGGLIFISRGLLRCGKTEDAVAAVLAHEIGHVQQKHGLQAIKKSRITAALTSAAIVGIKAHGDKDLVALTETFGDSIADITNTLITNGYSRSFEKEADLAAVTILQRVGYDPNGMVDMLTMMKTKLQPGGLDFAKTHPSPDSRIADIQEKIGAYAAVKPSAVRQKRLTAALGNI